MRMRRFISQLSPQALALAAALILSANAHSQEAQPLPEEKSQNAEAPGKTTCPPTRKIRMPMHSGALRITEVPGAIVFEAGLAIDADGAPNAYAPHGRGLDRLANARHGHRWVGIATDKHGLPLVQKKGRYRGYYVSVTSLQESAIRNRGNPAKYTDSTTIPYIALPPEVASRFGIALGDLAVVVNQRSEPPVSVFAIYADTGPRGKVGEGSIALAEALGLPSDPRHDRTEDGLLYVVFPGSGLGPGKLRTLEEINSDAADIYTQWGGQQSLLACSLLRDTSVPVAEKPIQPAPTGTR
jgi:hypothetical protein